MGGECRGGVVVAVGDIGIVYPLQYPYPVLSEYALPLLRASPSYNVHGFVAFVTRNICVIQKQLTIVLQIMKNYPRILSVQKSPFLGAIAAFV